jgi:hypothetical protein
MALVSAGAYRLGYVVSSCQTLEARVASAASVASRMEFDAQHPEQFRAAVRNLVVYGCPHPKRTPLVDGISPEDVRVSWTRTDAGKPARVTVSLSGAEKGSLLGAMLRTRRPAATVDYRG